MPPRSLVTALVSLSHNNRMEPGSTSSQLHYILVLWWMDESMDGSWNEAITFPIKCCPKCTVKVLRWNHDFNQWIGWSNPIFNQVLSRVLWNSWIELQFMVNGIVYMLWGERKTSLIRNWGISQWTICALGYASLFCMSCALNSENS